MQRFFKNSLTLELIFQIDFLLKDVKKEFAGWHLKFQCEKRLANAATAVCTWKLEVIGHITLLFLGAQTPYSTSFDKLAIIISFFIVDFEQQIFLRSFSFQFYLLSEFLPEICWEEVFFYILRFDVWPGVWTQALCLISQHITY